MEQTDSVQASPVSPRPRARPYRDYVAQQRALMASNAAKPLVGEGSRLLRQMMIGFACAALLGLVMFVLGAVFIAEAMEKKESITIMLCIMGIGENSVTTLKQVCMCACECVRALSLSLCALYKYDFGDVWVNQGIGDEKAFLKEFKERVLFLYIDKNGTKV